MHKYILVLTEDNSSFIAIDSKSGGYPYIVKSVWRAQLFDSEASAEEYNTMKYNCYIQKVTIKISNP